MAERCILGLSREEVIATTVDAAELTVHVEGPAAAEGRLALTELIVLARGLQEGIERVGLVLSGVTSQRPGRRPSDLVDRTRLEMIRFGPGGSAVLTLGLAKPMGHEQLTAFEPEDAADLGQRAVQRFIAGFAALSAEGALPPGWDAGVLSSCAEIFQLFDRGVDRIDIEGIGEVAGAAWHERAIVEPSRRAVVAELMRGPLRERGVIHGRLLMADFKEAGLRCRIHPPVGPSIECTFSEALRDRVLRALTKHVTLGGQASLDPESGRIRAFEIEEIEVIDVGPVVEGGGSFWVPSTIEELADQQGVRPIRDIAALAADFWPPGLNVDDFLALIDDEEPGRPVPA